MHGGRNRRQAQPGGEEAEQRHRGQAHQLRLHLARPIGLEGVGSQQARSRPGGLRPGIRRRRRCSNRRQPCHRPGGQRPADLMQRPARGWPVWRSGRPSAGSGRRSRRRRASAGPMMRPTTNAAQGATKGRGRQGGDNSRGQAADRHQRIGPAGHQPGVGQRRQSAPGGSQHDVEQHPRQVERRTIQQRIGSQARP